MKDINVQYSFSNKDFRKRLLRHIRIIYFITIPQVLCYVVTWIITILNAYKNNDVALITGAITIILVMVSSICLGGYHILFRNRLITARNFAYEHNIIIENNYIKVTLKSIDSNNSEHYEFIDKKIKKEGDTYIIYKNRNHFIYLPTKYVEEK